MCVHGQGARSPATLVDPAGPSQPRPYFCSEGALGGAGDRIVRRDHLRASGPARRLPGGLDLAGLRQIYAADALDEQTIAGTWLEQFTRWFTAAQEDDAITEPNAMQLATADPDGHASVRTVLAKG